MIKNPNIEPVHFEAMEPQKPKATFESVEQELKSVATGGGLMTIQTEHGVSYTIEKKKDNWSVKEGVISIFNGTDEAVTIQDGRLLFQGEDKGLITSFNNEAIYPDELAA